MEPILVQIAKMHFLLQNHFLGPKVHFEPKMHFWRKQWLWAKRAIFSKPPPWNSHELTYRSYIFAIWPPWCPKMRIVAPKIAFWLQNRICALLAFWAPKRTFHDKVHFCAPMPRMLIKPMGIWSKWSPFGPKCDFGPKSAIWSPKWVFGPKRRKIA